MTPSERSDRLTAVATIDLQPDSLVGSFFHSDADRGWQGCVVAEPVPGSYLAELFSWVAGDSTHQVIVHLIDMADWRFYDTAEWMNNAYEHGLSARWDNERKEPAT